MKTQEKMDVVVEYVLDMIGWDHINNCKNREELETMLEQKVSTM